MQLLLVNQIVQSFVHSFIHSSIIQSSHNHKSKVISLIISLVLLVKHLLVQFSLVILCSRYLVATPCSSFIRLLSLSLVTCSFSIYHQRSLVVRHPLCSCHSLLSSLRYLVKFVRHSLLVTPPTESIRSLRVPHTHTHTQGGPSVTVPFVPCQLFQPLCFLYPYRRYFVVLVARPENKTK